MKTNRDGQTIWLPRDVKERLDTLKLVKNEPYYNLIQRMMDDLDACVCRKK